MYHMQMQTPRGNFLIEVRNKVSIPWNFTLHNSVHIMKEKILTWETQKLTLSTEWDIEERENKDGDYIDLKKNPERSTGYQDQRIWNTIYSEGCFTNHASKNCTVEPMIYRLISGMHASISVHISEFSGDGKKTKPNLPYFYSSVGDHPDRIENVYFTYSILMRAFSRAQNYIQNYKFETGNHAEDLSSALLVKQIYGVISAGCNHGLNSSEFNIDISKVISFMLRR
jgi:hypothetical protein